MDRELNFEDYLGIVRRRWLVIALMALLGGAVAAARAWTAPLMYRVEVLLGPSEADAGGALRSMSSQLGPLSTMIGLPADAGPEKSIQAIATLTTPAFLMEFIESRGLLPELFPERWDEAAANWHPHWWRSDPNIDDAYARIVEDVLRITRDKDSGFWTLEVIWTDRHQAAEWAGELVAAVNQHVRLQSQEEAVRAIAYLGAQLEATANVAVRDSIFSLMEGQMNRQMLASIRPDFALKVIGPPVVPAEENFAYPRRKVLVMLGTMGGFAIGLAIAFLLERRRILRELDHPS
jgi:hypothetical protein